jgi:hypothetical protein
MMQNSRATAGHTTPPEARAAARARPRSRCCLGLIAAVSIKPVGLSDSAALQLRQQRRATARSRRSRSGITDRKRCGGRITARRLIAHCHSTGVLQFPKNARVRCSELTSEIQLQDSASLRRTSPVSAISSTPAAASMTTAVTPRRQHGPQQASERRSPASRPSFYRRLRRLRRLRRSKRLSQPDGSVWSLWAVTFLTAVWSVGWQQLVTRCQGPRGV